MAVTFRSFEQGDSVAIAHAWSKAAPKDPITPKRFRELILLDRNFDPAGLIIAESPEGDIAGVSYGVRRLVAHHGSDLQETTGWIPFFFVVPEAQGKGLGRQLVEATIQWLKGHGVSEVFFSCYTPNYVLPGLDSARYPQARALLGSLGFELFEQPSSMQKSLLEYEIPADVSEKIDQLRGNGWFLGTATEDDLVPLIQIAYEFNSDWARAIREGFLNGMPLERILIAKNPEGQMLGWAMHGTYEHVIDRFGPFGVLPESRGTGLGKAILHLTLQHMAAQGAHSAWFLWADKGSVASALYERTGFEITRTFDILKASV